MPTFDATFVGKLILPEVSTGPVPPSLGIWGPTDPRPTPPIYRPPIYLPPGTLPGLKPDNPIYVPPAVWPSPPNVPTHPIALPPPGSAEPPEVLDNWDVKTAWSEQSGWVVAIVPSQSHPGVPTPSAPTP
jgi:hypothetical protein